LAVGKFSSKNTTPFYSHSEEYTLA